MPAAQSIVSGLSGRYATALFDLAEESKALDTIEADLKTVRAMLQESDDLRRLVASPRIGRKQQADALMTLGREAGLNDISNKFLGALANNRRLSLLSTVIGDVFKLLAHHRGEIVANVETAQQLSDEQRSALAKRLKNAMGRDVAIQETVDPDLLGGLRVKVGSRLIDGSLKTKLDTLEQSMKGV